MDDKIREEISELERNGKFTDNDIYEAAKVRGTALHEYFRQREVWDKDKAQHRWGLVVAAELRRKIKVIQETEYYEVRVPQYIRDPSKGPHEQGVINVEVLRRNENQFKEALIPYIQRARANIQTALALSQGLDDPKISECLEEAMKYLNDQVIEVIKKRPPAKRKPGKNQRHEITT